MLVEKLLSRARERLTIISDVAPLIEAARLLRSGADIVVACNKSGLVTGVISKTDVVSQISHCQGASCMAAAASVMTRDVVVCQPGDWLHDVWVVMKKRGLKNVPITGSDARPVGVLTARVALEALLGEVENEEELLRDYVMSVGYR